MKDIKRYNKYKWMALLGFSVMYNFVYVGRFNVTNLMLKISDTANITVNEQSIIAAAVLFSYALGSMINGILSDKYGGKKMILIGGCVSIYANMATVMASSWQCILLLQTVNGFFQSMIWVGGISMLAQWLPPKERGMGVGIANFFSGLSHVTASLLPALFVTLMPGLSWKGQVVFPMYAWGILLIIFCIIAAAAPERKGLTPYRLSGQDKRHEKKANALAGNARGGLLFFKENKSFFVWCAIALLSSFCRYGLLNWIPAYFHADTGTLLLSNNFLDFTLPFGMALGTLVITWLGGTKFSKNKGLVIVWASALCGTLIIVFPMVELDRAVLMGIFFSGFFLYGINGMLWLYAIEAGGRYFSGTIAGFLNGAAYLGATLESFIFPAVIKASHSMLSVFVVMEVICIAMIICGIIVSKKNTVAEPEVRE
ncbi:MAG: MFS transporter [Eubacteriaceae bacterium]|nr:MFS transporter [Eubacteriaceae bacterium]